MKKLILIGIGIVVAVAFIGFDTVSAFMHRTRDSIRNELSSPELDLECKLNEARELCEKCADSVIKGRMHVARLDAMVGERERQLQQRHRRLVHDRKVLENRRMLLAENRQVYVIGEEEVSRRTLNRDAVLRAKAYQTDRQVVEHLEDTIAELKAQHRQTGVEIESAEGEQARLRDEIVSLRAELENLKARRAVARTREEAGYLFDRSAFDHAREKVVELRATIAEQNKRLDFYSRAEAAGRGLIPAPMGDEAAQDGLSAIEAVLNQ